MACYHDPYIMNRRDLIKIGAGVAAMPVHANPPAVFSPKFFDAYKNEMVIAPTKLIIPATDTPGAKGARVSEWSDKFFADGRVEERSQFLAGLGSLDAIALIKHAQPFDLDKSNGRFFRQAKTMTSRIYYAGRNHPEHA